MSDNIPIGTIHCLSCGKVFEEPPEGWDCPGCGGMVAQRAGTIHVGQSELERMTPRRGAFAEALLRISDAGLEKMKEEARRQFEAPTTQEESMVTTQADIEQMFTYHPPETEDQKVAYENVRAQGKALAVAILESTPRCADQSAAIRKVREAVMTANAAIALKGQV